MPQSDTNTRHLLRARAITWMGLLLLLLAMTPLQGCTYIERFYVIVNENRFPCVGVVSFSFTLEALEAGQDAISNELKTVDANPSSLLWDQTGNCQKLAAGVPIKKIPYGGQRQLTVEGFDSSGELVAHGRSTSFYLEASGSNVEAKLFIDLVRGCKQFTDDGNCANTVPMSLATVVVRFPIGTPPLNTARFIFRLTGQAGTPSSFTRTINITDGVVPQFVVLSNVPSGGAKSFEVFALDQGGQQLKQWTGQYTIDANPQPQQAVAFVDAQVK